MLYWLFILFYVIIVITVNVFVSVPIFGFEFWYVVLATVVSTVAVIAIDGIMAFFVRWVCPAKWFSFDKMRFSGKEKECGFYEKIGIKKWKDKIPELGRFTDFRKNKIAEPNNSEYVKRYILEANYGVAVHFAGMIYGFLIIFIFPLKYCLCFGVPVAIYNLFYNFLSLAVLRYNLPKLHRLYKINERREKRKSTLNLKTE